MKKIIFIVCVASTLSTFAQAGLDEMIAAEKKFAAYAVANNTVDAFLKYMDTSAIMFKEGEPYKAYASWQKKEKRPGVLNWWPRYAEVAASGDFGYTCGPWTFQPASANDSVVARGYFFTIWQKNNTGEWKFILDVGTDAGSPLPDTAVVKLTPAKTQNRQADIFTVEQNFIGQYNQDAAKALQTFVSGNCIYSREKSGLHSDIALDFANKRSDAGSLNYTPLGSGITSSGDLAYVYGSVTFNGKKETYLRIWRHEPTGWKIALQMVRH